MRPDVARGPVPTLVPRPVPPELWGRDHYTVLLYAGHVAHSATGAPDRDKMRIRPGSPMAGPGHLELRRAGLEREYPTRLRDGAELRDHDDYDCMDDLVAAGLFTNHGSGMHPVWRTTRRGLLVWSTLIRYRNEGGKLVLLRWPDLCAMADVPVEADS